MKPHRKINEILSSGGTLGQNHGIQFILSNILTKLMVQAGMTGHQWHTLIDEFARSEVDHPDNRKDMASIRGNLNKEFTREKMTFKVFCKAMKFLQFPSWKITITATMRNGQVIQYEQCIENAQHTRKNRARGFTVDNSTALSRDSINPTGGSDDNKHDK